MRGRRSPWLFILIILTGALIGGFAGELLSRHPNFAWTSLGGRNGYRELFAFAFNPLVDAGVIRLGFDVAVRLNAGSILGMVLGFLVFLRI